MTTWLTPWSTSSTLPSARLMRMGLISMKALAPGAREELTKIDPETGLVLKVNGKVQKPEGFVPVDLRSSIYPCKH